jgi:histidyl-tRNA synthetase
VKVKPSIPKGMRDFSPKEVQKRNYIFNTIRPIFEKYGYQPLETPTMENLTTLTGKYGEEGDQLLFKVLNSGDFLQKANQEALAKGDSSKLSFSIAEKGLRYDLTVPFARYVAQHQNEITFPFRRYQIQPVWRADRPQKGRYREFFQCDADVVGSDALINEVEYFLIFDEVFRELGLTTTIHFNNRKILEGVCETLGIGDSFSDFTIAIDKLDKIGEEKVKQELAQRTGLNVEDNSVGNILDQLFALEGTSHQKLEALNSFIGQTEKGARGIEEAQYLIDSIHNDGAIANSINLSVTLARGLDYYTGAIFEVTADDVAMGSIGGGGRYDNLTGMFGLKGVSGVGISFGVERIYDVMEELNRFPEGQLKGTELLFVNFGDESERRSFRYLQQLRQEGVASELYPDPVKLKKQMKYADDKQIPFVVMIGDEELALDKLKLRDMASGKEELLNIEELIHKFAG